MFDTEVITYPSRGKAVEALVRLRANTAIKRIDIGNYGRTLTLTVDNGAHDVAEVIHDEHSGAFADYDDYDDADAFVEPVVDTELPEPEPDDAADAQEIADLLGGREPSTEAEPEPSGVEAPAEPVETPEEPSAPAVPVPDVSEASRATLRQTVEEWGLDVEIPGSGALAPVREAVAAALADVSNE